MVKSIDQFLTIWQIETSATIYCLKNLTDESLDKKLISGYRSIGRIANHLVNSAIDIPKEATLPVTHTRQSLTHVIDLIDAYVFATDKVRNAVPIWTDKMLKEEVPMYGYTWTKGFALWVTVAHQIHHRGQLTALMRAAGLKVLGPYGPAKEEWEAMGLPEAD